MVFYDTSAQDMPLRDISNNKVKTYPEFSYYKVYDEADPNMLFAEGIDLSSEVDNVPRNVEIIRDDHRVKHIQVKGSLVVAIAAMNEMDNVPL